MQFFTFHRCILGVQQRSIILHSLVCDIKFIHILTHAKPYEISRYVFTYDKHALESGRVQIAFLFSFFFPRLSYALREWLLDPFSGFNRVYWLFYHKCWSHCFELVMSGFNEVRSVRLGRWRQKTAAADTHSRSIILFSVLFRYSEFHKSIPLLT